MIKQDSIKGFKTQAFDWVFKGLIAVVCFLVKDMHADLKMLMTQMPAIRADVDNLKDKNLMERFRYHYEMKREDPITYDSLMQK